MRVHVVVSKKSAVRRTAVNFEATPKRGKKVFLPSSSAAPMGGGSS